MFGQKSCGPAVVLVERHVHKAADGKDQQAGADEQARIEPLHQERHERDQQQLRQPGPGDHLAGLLRVEALRDGEVLGQQIGGSVEREAKQEVAQRPKAKVTPAEQPEIDQRLRRHEFEHYKSAERHRRHEAQFDNERRAEPVIDIAVVEHGL